MPNVHDERRLEIVVRPNAAVRAASEAQISSWWGRVREFGGAGLVKRGPACDCWPKPNRALNHRCGVVVLSWHGGSTHMLSCCRKGFRLLFVGASPQWCGSSDVVQECRHAGLGLIKVKAQAGCDVVSRPEGFVFCLCFSHGQSWAGTGSGSSKTICRRQCKPLLVALEGKVKSERSCQCAD